MRLSTKRNDLLSTALGLVEDCNVSQGNRASAYKTYGQWIETGRGSGGLATANLLYGHTDRVATHLFSPIELRFNLSSETKQPKNVLDQFEMSERVLTHMWNNNNLDITFGNGVLQALRYGACIMKQLVEQRPTDKGWVFDRLTSRLVFPWNFGVYNEGLNSLDEQEAMCETVYLNKHQVWRRIQHLPDADKLYRKIVSSSEKGDEQGGPLSFMHQVLSTAVLDTSLSNASPVPGGIVDLSNNSSAPTLGPQVQADLYPMYELTVWDDNRDDWSTIQIMKPDILITNTKTTNLFAPGALCYGLIQPNQVDGYFWGRSEIVDLMMLQELLAQTLDDGKRLMGLQVDKILGFSGDGGIDDERYDQFRQSGYVNMGPGGNVSDLTPNFPPELLNFVKQILELMDLVSGFSGILTGQGVPGVRAGEHADTLMRTGSTRLRDRSLLVERQCAQVADTTLHALEAKDGKSYWTDADDIPGTSFLLSELPEDRQVTVDSHSTSPIYMADHANLTFAGLKAGLVDPVSAIEDLQFTNKDLKIERLKEREEARQQMMQQLAQTDPEAAAKLMKGD